MRQARIMLGAAVVTGVVLMAPPSAHAVTSAVTTSPTWKSLPPLVVRTQTVWALASSAGLPMTSQPPLSSKPGITVQACPGQAGYFLQVAYARTRAKRISVNEQPGAGCSEDGGTGFGLVVRFNVPKATISIWAGCGLNTQTLQPRPGWKGTEHCPTRSVLAAGGWIRITQTAHTTSRLMSTTNITTTGLTYLQAMEIARGLRPMS